MPVSVTMPRLGESVTEGTVTRWLKQVGERVEVDEPLLEVSTDKVDTEIPSPAAGVLQKILVAEDETAEVGSELAIIGDGEDGGAADSAPPAQGKAASVADQPAENQAATDEAVASEPSTEKPAGSEQPATAPQAKEQSSTGSADGAQAGGTGTPVKMPALGESVTEGTVTRWLKQVGETVEVDEPLLEVSTDKVDTEIPSPVAGTLLEISVPEDETAAVGATLAVIGVAGGAASTPDSAPAPSTSDKPAAQAELATAAEPAKTEPAKAAPAQGAVETAAAPVIATEPQSAKAQAAPAEPSQGTASAPASAPAADGSDGYVTPLVRKLAGQHNVDLSKVEGTGVGGRIRKQDVLDAAEKAKAAAAKPAPAAAPASKAAGKAAPEKAAPSPLRGRTEKLPRLRMTIAKRMVESLQVSAQLTTVVEVDVTRIAKLREQAKKAFLETHGVKLSYLPFFALAAVEALRAHPNVNASMDMEAGTVTYHDAEHLGMAVDTEKGLIVPVIKNAGDLNLAGLAKRIADVAERTRSNKIMPDDISGGTFTLTNTGSRGALFDTPIINQPQVAILGTGAVVKRAVVVDDSEFGEIITPRSMVYLALSYDHRLVDGADAARFLSAIKERLETGNFEAELGL
jgi:pyruvate dehydrogenase E2 component (dihydrolipoamide acetyltransferase)